MCLQLDIANGGHIYLDENRTGSAAAKTLSVEINRLEDLGKTMIP
jgi:hypothetical protein